MQRQRLPAAERIAAWIVTGPVGHLVAGALDWGQLLARVLVARARGKEVEPL